LQISSGVELWCVTLKTKGTLWVTFISKLPWISGGNIGYMSGAVHGKDKFCFLIQWELLLGG